MACTSIEAAGRQTTDPGFLYDDDEGLLRGLERFQEGWEVGALPELGYPQLQTAKPASSGRSRYPLP